MPKKLTTAEFIERARAVHGNRYDYTESVCKGSKAPITIICPDHGDFEQAAGSHLGGRGCPECGRCSRGKKQRKTTERFIAKARAIHRDKYDYGKAVYTNAHTKVVITCPEHGDFEQTPAGHYRGGCLKCAGRQKLTTEEFIERARLVHGDKYDYSNVEYKTSSTKVRVRCPEHGEWLVTPASHLRQGTGCRACAGLRKLTTIEFIERARARHGDRYDYSQVVYLGGKKKVTIRCPDHGDFAQAPTNHLSLGQGCPKCANKVPWTMETVIDESKRVHGDRFDYEGWDALVYQGQKKTILTLRCPDHGEFRASVADHFRYKGGGCGKCAKKVRSKARRAGGEREFLEWFKENRSDSLELLSQFAGMTRPITVRCKIHDLVQETKPTHLTSNGSSGCEMCGRDLLSAANRLSREEIVERFEPDLPDNVQIIDVGFDEEKGTSKVIVNCEEHGRVEMILSTFDSSAYKCVKCGNEATGYAGYRLRRLLERGERGLPTWVAVMEVEVFGIRALKVGITSRTLEERYTWYLKTVFFSAKLEEIDALLVENQIRRKFAEHRDHHIQAAGMREGSRWSGDTECYDLAAREGIEAHVKAFINDIETREPDYWAEFEAFEHPFFHERDVGREKGHRNLPKAVVCVETGECFASIADAQRQKGVHGISMALISNGKKRPGGYRWVTVEDYEAGNIPSK